MPKVLNDSHLFVQVVPQGPRALAVEPLRRLAVVGEELRLDVRSHLCAANSSQTYDSEEGGGGIFFRLFTYEIS